MTVEGDLLFNYEPRKRSKFIPLWIFLAGLLLFVLSITVLGKLKPSELKPMAALVSFLIMFLSSVFGLIALFAKSYTLILTHDSIQRIHSKSGKSISIPFREIQRYGITNQSGIVTLQIEHGPKHKKFYITEALFDTNSDFDVFFIYFEQRMSESVGSQRPDMG